MNLGDPRFDLADIPRAIGLSSRTLSRAFAQQNIIPAKWLWAMRPARCSPRSETGARARPGCLRSVGDETAVDGQDGAGREAGLVR